MRKGRCLLKLYWLCSSELKISSEKKMSLLVYTQFQVSLKFPKLRNYLKKNYLDLYLAFSKSIFSVQCSLEEVQGKDRP